jgi:hypothetical protein
VGFNQCYISTIENLQKELDNVGLEIFVNRYQKYECLTGTSESMNFIEDKVKLWHTINLDGGQKEKHIIH